MSKHTPGPWTVVQDTGAEDDYYVITEKEDVLATGLSEADADLIAAAPDLLAVCKRMVDHAGIDMSLGPAEVLRFVEIYREMRAAIAKAEGVS